MKKKGCKPSKSISDLTSKDSKKQQVPKTLMIADEAQGINQTSWHGPVLDWNNLFKGITAVVSMWPAKGSGPNPQNVRKPTTYDSVKECYKRYAVFPDPRLGIGFVNLCDLHKKPINLCINMSVYINTQGYAGLWFWPLRVSHNHQYPGKAPAEPMHQLYDQAAVLYGHPRHNYPRP